MSKNSLINQNNSVEKSRDATYNGGNNMKKIMKPLKELDLLDRFLFARAMEDEIIHKNILEILLGEEIHLLDSVQTEKEFRTSPLLRSIRVDVYSLDEEKTIYNTEAQKENKGNLPRRSRFYQALIDSSLLEPGVTNFNVLNNMILIMIAPFDLFGHGKYKYTFRMKCDEVEGLELEDGVTRIFYNTRGTNEEEVTPELVELLHYIEHTTNQMDKEFECTKIQEIQKRINQMKLSEEMGVRYMQLWEEKAYEREEALEEGRKEAELSGIKAMIASLRECGIDDGTICSKLMVHYHLTKEQAEEKLKA